MGRRGPEAGSVENAVNYLRHGGSPPESNNGNPLKPPIPTFIVNAAVNFLQDGTLPPPRIGEDIEVEIFGDGHYLIFSDPSNH